MWEAGTGQEVARMMHDSDVGAVAFSSDGKYVISDGCRKNYSNRGNLPLCFRDVTQVRMWRPEDLIKDACLLVSRNLTSLEWMQYIGDALPYQAVCPNLPIEAESTPMP